MYDVPFLPAAQADFQEALTWYRARSARAAAAFETAIDIALRRIATSPNLFALMDDRHRFYILRKFPYSIVYRTESTGPLVVAIAHSSRDDSFWRSRS